MRVFSSGLYPVCRLSKRIASVRFDVALQSALRVRFSYIIAVRGLLSESSGRVDESMINGVFLLMAAFHHVAFSFL